MAKKDLKMKQSNKASVTNCKNNKVSNANANRNVTNANSNKVSNKVNNEIGFDDDEAHSFELDEDNGDSFRLI